MIVRASGILILFYLTISCNVLAQGRQDSIDLLDNLNFLPKNTLLHNIFQDAMNSMRRSPGDTASNVLLVKSEQTFMKHEGKFIRNIVVQRFGFERTFTDTSNRITFVGTKILNALHPIRRLT